MKNNYLLTLFTLLPSLASMAQNIPSVQPSKITPAQLQLLNTDAQSRYTKPQACMEVKQQKVDLVLWDCGIEDNDTIALNLNGQWVLDNFRLTNAKQYITITVQPGENKLMLLAKNLGDIPDNTAAMGVMENGVEKKVTLSSNLHTNGALNMVFGANTLTGGNYIKPCPDDKQVFMDDESNRVRQNPDLANPAYSFLYKGVRMANVDPYRSIEMQGCNNTSEQNVALYFWDSGVEDGDTISVNLNGEWVIKDMLLTKEPKTVNVKLNPGNNYIIMYANNLGSIPNNTSGIGVSHRYGKQDLGTMFSDLGTCGTYRVFCSAAGANIENGPCVNTQQAQLPKNDPEMNYLYGSNLQYNNVNFNQYQQQNTQQYGNPSSTYYPGADVIVGGAVIGIGTIFNGSHNNGSGNGGSSGTGGGQTSPTQHRPIRTTPAPAPKPQQY